MKKWEEDLEMIVDKHSFTELIEALSEIAGEKAYHLEQAWGDENQARKMAHLGNYLNSVAERVLKREQKMYPVSRR